MMDSIKIQTVLAMNGRYFYLDGRSSSKFDLKSFDFEGEVDGKQMLRNAFMVFAA